MATLAVDTPRVYETGHDEFLNQIPAIASDIVYEGAAVGESSTSGDGRPLVAGDTFLGFCTDQCDNSAGSAGTLNIKVKGSGIVELSVTGVTGVGNIGATVYASDDATFTLTSTSNTAIGKIIRYESGTVVLVKFAAAWAQSL